jgi:hypothetical protein
MAPEPTAERGTVGSIPPVAGDWDGRGSNVEEMVRRLEQALAEERRRLTEIERELVIYKTALEKERTALPPLPVVEDEAGEDDEIVDLDARLEVDDESTPVFEESVKGAEEPMVGIALFEASRHLFGIRTDLVTRSFEVKKWVAEFFLKGKKVKLRDREIPLFDVSTIVNSEPSAAESRLVVLFSGGEGREGAIVVDQSLGERKIRVESSSETPYILGTASIEDREIWVLDPTSITRRGEDGTATSNKIT